MLERILNFILVEANIEFLLLVFIPTALLVGFIGGLLYGRAVGLKALYTVKGTLLGFTGLLVWIMWQVYNVFIDWYGLDTIKNLLMNLALFVTVGVALGYAIRMLNPRLDRALGKATNTGPEPPPPRE
jgi:hypothetical protein